MSITPQPPTNGSNGAPPEWLLSHRDAVVTSVDGQVDSIRLKFCGECQVPLMFCLCSPKVDDCIFNHLFYSRTAGLNQKSVDRMEAVLDARPVVTEVPPAEPAEPEASSGTVAPILPTTELPYLKAALDIASRGMQVFTFQSGTKGAKVLGWEELCTTNPAAIRQMAIDHPDWTNYGSVAKAVLGGFWILEVDSPEVVKQIEAETGQKIPPTLRVRSSPGKGHMYWRQTPASILMGNITQAPGIRDWSARVNNQYVCGPMSVNPVTGLPYEIISDAVIPEAPDWLVAWCDAQNKKSSPKTLAVDEEAPIPEGKRNVTLASIAGKLRSTGANYDEIEARLLRENQKCTPPLDDDDVKVIANSICRYAAGRVHEVTFSGVPAGTTPATALVTKLITNDPTNIAARLEECKAKIAEAKAIEAAEPEPDLDTKAVTPRPIFPSWVMKDTSLYEGVVKPGIALSTKLPELIWMSGVMMVLNYVSTKVRIAFGNDIHNIFLGIVSPPGEFFKSSAFELAFLYMKLIGLFEDWDSEMTNANSMALMMTGGSPEGVGLNLKACNCRNCILYYDELSTFVKKAGIEGSAFTPNLLSFYESRKFANAIKRKKESFSFAPGSYCFGWAWCATDIDFNKSWAGIAGAGSGLLDRMFLMVTPAKARPADLHQEPSRSEMITAGVLTRQRVENAITQGVFDFENRKELSASIKGTRARSIDLVVKIALYFAIDLGRTVIDQDCVNRALAVIDYRNQSTAFLAPPEADTVQGLLQQLMIKTLQRNSGKMALWSFCHELNYRRYGTALWGACVAGLVNDGTMTVNYQSKPKMVYLLRPEDMPSFEIMTPKGGE